MTTAERIYALMLAVAAVVVVALSPGARQRIGRSLSGLRAPDDRQCEACVLYRVRATGPDWCLAGGITRPHWSCAAFHPRESKQEELQP